VVQSDGDDLIQGNCSGLFQCVRELYGLHLDSPRESKAMRQMKCGGDVAGAPWC
jgi:hypothetical protein